MSSILAPRLLVGLSGNALLTLIGLVMSTSPKLVGVRSLPLLKKRSMPPMPHTVSEWPAPEAVKTTWCSHAPSLLAATVPLANSRSACASSRLQRPVHGFFMPARKVIMLPASPATPADLDDGRRKGP